MRSLNEVYSMSKYGKTLLLIHTILTLGLNWVIIFLFYGIVELTIKQIAKKNYAVTSFKERELSILGKISLVTISVVTLGLIWAVYLFLYGYIEFIFKMITKKEVTLSDFGIVSIMIGTICTLGFGLFITLLTYGLIEGYGYILNKQSINNNNYFSIYGIISLFVVAFFGFNNFDFVVKVLQLVPTISDFYPGVEIEFTIPAWFIDILFLKYLYVYGYIILILLYGTFEFLFVKVTNGKLYLIVNYGNGHIEDSKPDTKKKYNNIYD